MLIVTVSCSTPQEKAEKQLQAQGIEATAEKLVVEAEKGNTANVQLLLAAGVSPDSFAENGATPLTSASSAGQEAVIDILLSAGGDIDQSDANGNTPLIIAVRTDNIPVAEKLVRAGANTESINNLGETALSIAIRNKNWPMVTALGKAGVNYNVQYEDGRTRLHDIISSGRAEKELVAALIEGGADVNIADDSGQTPFTLAVNRGEAELVALMVRHGADVNEVHFNNNSYPALLQAIQMKNDKLAAVLIDGGADVDFIVQKTGDSALHAAVKSGMKDIVAMLIKRGANVNVRNIFYETPLSEATVNPEGKDLDCARLLAQAGADLNALVSEKGRTSLHLAAMKGDGFSDSLQFLLENGADPNIYDNEGQTPLTLAVEHNNRKAVEILIEEGVDLNVPALNGETPLAMAERLDNYQIASKLRTAGAEQ